MDVKYINPFLLGTLDVLKKAAFIDAVPGKPSVKKEDSAFGDVSGIIGITGDAIGSLALSFSEESICHIVSKMLGEDFQGISQEILDAVGEITNMISGVSRTQMEKMGMSVYAAIPTVVHGKQHTINHILKSPSIVIPFSTPGGSFFVDVCIKTTEEREKAGVHYGVVNVKTETPPRPVPAPVSVPAASAKQRPDSPPKPQTPAAMPEAPKSFATGNDIEAAKQGAGDKIAVLKAKLKEVVAARDAILNELSSKPFMPFENRQKLKKSIPFYDQKIKKIKLDIRAFEMISTLSKDDLENPNVPKHYQNYDSSKKK